MSTTRVFLNKKRIATGRILENNTFLQVYPSLTKFVSEEAWRFYWTTELTNSITFKVEPVSVQPTKKKQKLNQPTGSNWICRYCTLGPGNDHRMCICRGYNYSVEAWENDRTWTAPSVSPTPVATPTPVPTKIIPGRSSKPSQSVCQKKNGRIINWTYYPGMTEATAPAGKYYIGDLCYALHKSTYDEVFGGSMYGSGLYECDTGFFMVDDTSYGDGLYSGSDGKEYGVDAGILGIASWSIVDKNNSSIRGGQVHEFKDPISVQFRDGKFTFISARKRLTIDTVGDNDD